VQRLAVDGHSERHRYAAFAWSHDQVDVASVELELDRANAVLHA
jgi:hypothetical protein